MCGRYNLVTNAQALIDFFEIKNNLFDVELFEPRYNIAPGQDVTIIRVSAQSRELASARWGLVPHWSKEPNPKYATINARAETVAEKPTYRDPFKRKRCLIPVTGFFEWQKKEGNKIPHHIRLSEGELFAFAGLWDHWKKDGEEFDSCSIIVTTANKTMQPIHQRMPVILNQSQYNTWLNTDRFNRAQLQSLLVPYASTMETYPVSSYVNNPTHNDSRCTKP